MADRRTGGQAGSHNDRGRVQESRSAQTTRVRRCLLGVVLLVAACGTHEDAVRDQAQSRQNDVPVAINGESPFQYPPDLYDQGIEGEVRLRLWVDSAGRVAIESTRVASSSGTPGLDSAALFGAAQLQFAPAHREGRPVAAAFYQPVIFRRRSAPGATSQ